MNPIKKQPIAVAIAVTVKAAPLLIPAALKILGLTKGCMTMKQTW